MTKEKFWQTIAVARSKVETNKSLNGSLRDELKKLPPNEIATFHKIYRLYMSAADKQSAALTWKQR